VPRFRPPLLFLLVLALLTPACTGGGLLSRDDEVIRIGFVTTMEGADAEAGVGSRNSLELAVRGANARKLVPGHRLQVAPVNDKADPAVGATVAAGLAADPSVVAVVDQAYSSVSQATIPVLARQGIAQVSAASTSPSLTLGPFPVDAPKRVWPNYFRLVPNDLLQGDFAANYAFGRGGFRTAATVNDRDLYGQGLVTTFERRWRLLGAEITSSRSVAEDEPRLPAVAAAIARERPQVVYFGGQDTAATRDFKRITGTYGFDEFGDTTRRTLTVNQVSGGEWKPVRSGPLGQ
jgi:branched-chain amino acid transport system substrate-binding protein